MNKLNDKKTRIESFDVDHTELLPGVYERKKQSSKGVNIITYDIRMTRPNTEPPMDTAIIHTIEHMIATYLRIHSNYSDDVVYFGPMGCRTGFYLVMLGEYPLDEIIDLLIACFKFVCEYEGDVPGATIIECGNYLDINLAMAQYVAKHYLENVLLNIK